MYGEFFEKKVYVPMQGHTGGKEKGPGTLGDMFGLTPHSNTQYGYMEITLKNGEKVTHGHIFNGRVSDRCYNHIKENAEKSGTTPLKNESGAKKTKVFEIKDGKIVTKSIKKTKLHSETAFIKILEEKYKGQVDKVELFTSQSPCFHNTFKPKPAKREQKTPCSQNLKEYAEKNPDVGLNVFFDKTYNPQSNKMNKEIPREERTDKFVERQWLKSFHQLPDNYKLFKKCSKETPTKFKDATKSSQDSQREE